MATTTLVALLKTEQDRTIDEKNAGEDDLNIVESYKVLWKVVNLRPIKILAAILLTVKFTFAACDSVTSLKLVEAGLPKDKLALLAIPMVPLQIFLPLVVSKYTTGAKPMEVYIKAIPYRILFGIFASAIVVLAPYTFSSNGDVPVYLYILLIVNYSFYQIFLYCMFVAVMAFFAKISDPAVGGTYMTLLNTICNLGGNWPTSIVLWLVDVLTWKQCAIQTTELNLGLNNTCQTKTEEEVCRSQFGKLFYYNRKFMLIAQSLCLQECVKLGGKCETSIDGYYLECLICLIYGLCWYKWGTSQIRYLQSLPLKVWKISKGEKSRR